MHAVAAISQSALAHNLSIVRAQAPHSKIVSMVKANAYGHHLANSKPLLQADLLGVSELSEARQLRQLCDQPILVLSGVYSATDLNEVVELGCHVVIHHPSQITTIANTTQALNVWLKVDTGMHRLGLSADELNSCIQQLAKNPNIHIEAVMSHFACADEPSNAKNLQQISHFSQLDIARFNRSMANSAAILSRPSAHFDYVRPGVMLYGVSPFGKPDESLQPVMQLSAPVLSIKKINAGDQVGYGATWQAEEDTIIAIIGIGYADGYPRHAKNGTPVLINNKLYPLAGRVSMDLICVDIGDALVNIGDKAILWGHPKLRVETIAQYSDTIGYELLTHVSSRVNFIQS
ncbi:MAG: alanine racemase [Candidatus Thioglobus sp.]|nr:alanine racemase [Candidatus Thioglobus pontius]MBL6977233.1 alanine racemase [Candidatus Thioglobus sp.]MBL6985185.1 alanine racemase [Candidatus Thioglobus sp.]